MPIAKVKVCVRQSGADSAASATLADDRTAATQKTTSSKNKLAFVIAHLGPGGAQRVAVTAANALIERGIEVHLIVIDPSHPVGYAVDPRVVLHPDELRRRPIANGFKVTPASERRKLVKRTGPLVTLLRPLVRGAFLVRAPIVFSVTLIRRLRSLRRAIKASQANIVLSFLTQTNILTVIATRGLKTRTIVSERNDPRLQRHLPRIEIMRSIVYRWADVVTANSRGALVTLEAYVAKDKLAFLPNTLAVAASGEVAKFAAPTIITVGRLVEQKGFNILLTAWATSHEQLPAWRLAIVGDGPLRSELQALSRDLQIESSVDWHGHVADPLPLLRGAKFFIQTSLFEGTPNALLEAMACGLPAIVSDASPGPCELVGLDECAGLIVPVGDVAATAEAIVRLAGDEALRRRFEAVARERTRAHELDQVIDAWLQILRCA